MPKRLNRPSAKKNATTLVDTKEIVQNVKTGNAKFHFLNGDTYEGQFIVQNGKHIFKQGYGMYKTNNFDIYSARWDQDNIASDLQIQYNNEMQYKGGINIENDMNNFGIYVFPDQSSIEGNWKKNKPCTNLHFVEPSGFKWKGLPNSEKEILFESENHFWKELYGDLEEKKNNKTSNDEVDESSKLSSKSRKRFFKPVHKTSI